MSCWRGYTLECIGGVKDGERLYYPYLPPTVTYERFLPNGDFERSLYALAVYKDRFYLRYINAQVKSRV